MKSLHKKEQLGGLSPIGYILKELQEKKYIYDHLINEHTNEITDILWVHPRSLELSSNEYQIPLMEVVGITSTMKTYSLMFAYLNNDTKERLIWALDTLKRWMVEKRGSVAISGCFCNAPIFGNKIGGIKYKFSKFIKPNSKSKTDNSS
ncbi:hypothetical protein RHMOL_Rhmol03G0181300 [Rhododendron molle]|uniref:Uncharacterized protein n=1 Tax=Rhododendron molle TaxID=49168 RepID=A0ACC0PH14_RHOML|nr:hypothetical protein RHMOL_Rhmol03G0181300 [Rhododendron molle]